MMRVKEGVIGEKGGMQLVLEQKETEEEEEEEVQGIEEEVGDS